MPNADEASGSMLEQNLSGSSEEERRWEREPQKSHPLSGKGWKCIPHPRVQRSSKIENNLGINMNNNNNGI